MIRKTRPEAGNKYYIRKANGGYSTCIQGKPTDKWCNVLSNCVGYACGAANEELGLGYEKYHLNCNAENFIERAIASGLSVYKTPQIGDIICWEGKGSLAGHVGIVVDIINNNCIKVAQSGWGSKNPFYITTNYNNNGRWGLGSNYPFRGFIRILKNNPKPEPQTKVVNPVNRDENKNQLKVLVSQLRCRKEPNLKGGIIGLVQVNKYYNYYDTKSADGYTWYEISDNQWIANNGKYLTILPKKEKPIGLKVGDKVKILKTGNANSAGTGKIAGGIGWTRYIKKIYSGKPYPYQVGDKTGTTGFYKENALKKI